LVETWLTSSMICDVIGHTQRSHSEKSVVRETTEDGRTKRPFPRAGKSTSAAKMTTPTNNAAINHTQTHASFFFY
jgi:hypothetical protein